MANYKSNVFLSKFNWLLYSDTSYEKICRCFCPFELLGMDLIGKLTQTDSGHQYICVMIDYLTKWPQAYPLRTKSAKEVTDCIIKHFYQFEAPKRILTDQGKDFFPFYNKRSTKMSARLAIQRSLCSLYHPQMNGLVEIMNGTIQRYKQHL
ncbi:unnamed protein product [Oncorhynchus mykiss]|uniref:Integrase catalytic domain-containing protein n=1 Tax=Oncorhynchus mykiss TaxID=8022 RepID=A0A060Z8F0_ONCMY|nr:unnamed protein product [Oncorhynchus mykiss]